MPRPNPYIRDFQTISPSAREALIIADDLRAEATIEDGVLRWNSNGHVPPADVVEYAAFLGLAVDEAACTAARDAEVAAAIADYRARQAGRTPEQVAEEHAEARAALGPGVPMVDVISGERFTT